MNNLFINIGFGLAIALLICLLPMPYGYYELIRFVLMIYFACTSYSFFKKENELLGGVSIAMAILFQPFFKIALGRGLWNVIDVVLAVIFIIVWFKNKEENK